MSSLKDIGKILNSLKEVLQEFSFIAKNESVPIYKLSTENDPVFYPFNWQPINVKSRPVKERSNTIAGLKETEDNIICQLCPERISGIRSFLKIGRKPILVVHYTGEISSGKKIFIKKSSKQTFRTTETEDIFSRMLKKVFGWEFDDLYYQEFPGCVFNQNTSAKSDWERRVTNCKSHLEKSIIDYKIQGVIFTGNAALLYFGDMVEKMTSSISEYEIKQKKIPMIVVRSPDAILAYENRRKKLTGDTEALEKSKLEEIQVKNSVIQQLTSFKERLILE